MKTTQTMDTILETAAKLAALRPQFNLLSDKDVAMILHIAINNELDLNECEDVFRYCTAK